MPSLDELTATSQRGNVTIDAPADVLAAVKAEGGRRRARRHRRNAFVAALGLVVLAVPAVALLSDGEDDQQLTVAAEDRSTTTATDATPTTAATTTQTTAVTDETVVVAPPETATTVPGRTGTTVPGRTGTTAVPRTTVPTVVCHNSTHPACGEFRWDPSVGNESLVASFATAPATAVVGEPVTFEVDWSDPDADDFGSVHSVNGAAVGAPCSTERRFGPWTPPPAQPGSGRVSFTETFATAGTYRIVVDLWTGNVCDHPHASEAHVVTTVTVADAPPPSG